MKPDCDTFAAHTCELDVSATACHKDLGVAVGAMRSLRGHVAAGEDSSSTAEASARETLDQTSELRAPIEGLTWTVCGERAHFQVLSEEELVRIQLVITAALSKNEGTASKPICDVHYRFPAK